MGSVGTSNQSAIKGVSGYDVTTASGNKMTYYLETVDGVTYYRDTINGVGEPTPNNMTEKEFIARIQENGGTVAKKSSSELLKEYEDYIKDREATSKFLDESYVRNKDADSGERAYRNYKRASRRNRRG